MYRKCLKGPTSLGQTPAPSAGLALPNLAKYEECFLFVNLASETTLQTPERIASLLWPC
jgi:hypothetical protein